MRQRLAGITLLLAGLWLLSAAQLAGADFSSKAEFLKIYEPAALAIQKVYGSLHIQGKSKSSNLAKADHIAPFEYWAHEGSTRLDVNDPDVGRTLIRVATPKESFRVYFEPADLTYTLDTVDKAPDEIRESMRLFVPTVFAPYCFREVTIAEFIRRDVITYVRHESVRRNKAVLTKVEFEWQTSPPGKAVTKVPAIFVFDAEHRWACVEYSAGRNDPIEATFTYEGLVDNVPLIKTARWSRKSEQALGFGQQGHVTKIVKEAPPGDTYFKLSGFGLEEPE